MKHVNDEFWQAFAPEVARVRAPPGQARVLHVRRGVRHHEVVHVALHDARRRAGGHRLPVPGRRRELRRAVDRRERPARLLRRRRLVHGRRLERLPAADVPREPRHGPHRHVRDARRTRARPTPSWWRATAWRTSSCTSRAATRSSTTATSRASRAAAATRSRGRTCSRAVTPDYLDDDLLGTDRDARRSTNFDPDASAVPRDRRPRAAHAAPRRAARRRADPPLRLVRASTPSRGSTASTRTSTWSRSTTPRARRPPPCRPTCRAAGSTASTAPGRLAEVRLRRAG